MGLERSFRLGEESAQVVEETSRAFAAERRSTPAARLKWSTTCLYCSTGLNLMRTTTTRVTRVVPLPFEKSLQLARKLLMDAGLTIVGEIEMSGEPYFHLGVARRRCVALLVDTPALLFEAIALDRSAAVFLPLHIVISGDRETSYVRWVDPAGGSGLRPPAPAKEALENVWERVGIALSALPAAAVSEK
jgi:hypothetical protein